MHKFEVRLDQVVLQVLRELRPLYPATRVTISELPIVDADPVAVHRLLANAIGGAFGSSACAPQPLVEISIDTAGAVQVIDNRPGGPQRFTVSFEDA